MDQVRQINSHEDTYLHQLESSWIVTTSLFEEGILVRSFSTPSAHTFVFDNSSVDALTSSSMVIPVPTITVRNSSFNEVVATKQSLTINCPTLWSAERPFIYTLVVTLRNASDGVVVQSESCRVGFRTIDIQNGLLRVNTHPITVRGVNYHEHDPVNGHTVNPALLEADIQLMKRNNFNAVRTSH
jgi:beta-galactosidase/beta-glucuronidase